MVIMPRAMLYLAAAVAAACRYLCNDVLLLLLCAVCVCVAVAVCVCSYV
jgi:hypothetical protein